MNNAELREQEVVLKLVNLRPEEIAMLPPTERASVIQLVRIDLIIWEIDSLECVDLACVVRHSLALPIVGFVFALDLPRPHMYSRAEYIHHLIY
jgi:hypothetical protein